MTALVPSPRNKSCELCLSQTSDPVLSLAFGRPVCVDCFAKEQIDMEDETGHHELGGSL